MKLIKKYDLGGLVDYQPLPLLETPSSGSSESNAPQKQTKEENVLDDKMIKELLGKGITNDVFSYQEKINNAYNEYASLTEAERNSVYGRRLRDTMRGDFATLNMLIRNKERFDKGIQNVKDNKAQGSIAVTSNGIMAINNETGNVEEVTYREIDKNRGKYSMIDNANLANYREINPNATNTTTTFVALDNAVSFENVNKYVNDILDKVTTSSNKESSNYFSKGNDKLIADAIYDIRDKVNGVYENAWSRSSKTNKQQQLAALEAIQRSLPENYLNLLRSKAISQGYSGAENIDNAVNNYIALLAAGRSINDVEASNNIGIIKDSDLNDSAGKNKNDSISWEQHFISGAGVPSIDMTLNVGNNKNIKIPSATFSNTYMVNNKPVTNPTMISDLGNFSAIADVNNLTVGDTSVPSHTLSQIMYNQGRVTRAKMFSKYEDGHIKPDLDLTKRASEAEKEIKKINARGEIASNIYKQYGIETMQDKEGNIIPVAPQKVFLVMPVVTNGNVVEDQSDPNLYTAVNDDHLQKIYENNYDYVDGKQTDSAKRKQEGYKTFFGFGNKTLYQTMLFAPVSEDMASAGYAGDEKTSVDPGAHTIGSQRRASQIIGRETYSPIYKNETPKVSGVNQSVLYGR